MNIKIIFTIVQFLAVGFTFSQDGPVHSAKLDKENGFKKLIIGKPLTSVKGLLQNDKVEPEKSLDAENYTPGYNTGIYFVDLKKSGYTQFFGYSIERIEVWCAPDPWSMSENPPDAISRVMIYLKKDPKIEDVFLKMMDAYGGAYPAVDDPEPGDTAITWVGENVLMQAANFYGGYEKPKRDFYCVRFSSSKGG